ncbi:MAG: NAD(P)/FAD-dependent oxidoreductase, partial [Bacteroidota bacterium]
DLRLPGEDAVFIIGDLAGSVDEQGELLPQVAPVAMQGGEHVAQQILRLQGGQATEAFQYRDKGMMATIGRHAAVAEIRLGKEVRTKGVIAWIMWLGLHLIMLIGFRNRLQVLVNWVWNYFTYDRSARLIMGDRRTAPKDRSVEPVVPEPTPELA